MQALLEMEMKLEVLHALAIQRKKPWPCFAWLQEGHDITNGLYLLDVSRISQLSLSTGKTRRNFPSLSGVQLALTRPSRSGAVLAGLTVHGHMFTWSQPSHELSIYTSPLSEPEPHPQDLKGCHLFVGDSGEQALLVTSTLELYMWELRDGLHPEWWLLPTPEDLTLPHTDSIKSAAFDATFYVHKALGECCECNIAYHTTEEAVVARCLLTWKQLQPLNDNIDTKTPSNLSQKTIDSESKINNKSWKRRRALNDTTNIDTSTSPVPSPHTKPAVIRSIPVNVDWKTCTVSEIDTLHHSSHGRGSYVVKISPTGRVSAVAINQHNAADTCILFLDLLNEVTVSSRLYTNVMSGRTYWITSLAWSGDGLLLAAMTHRGCLVLLPRFGAPLKLVTTGCSVDMGPTRFLPLHPLITVQNKSGLNVTDHENSDSSERDELRQRFSVAAHPSLPVILCSDGYCLTVLKTPPDSFSLPRLVHGLVNTSHSILGLPLVHPLNGKQTFNAQVGTSAVESELSVNEESIKSKGTKLLSPGSGKFSILAKSGVEDPHWLSRTHTADKLNESEKRDLAKVHLQAAWCLLLSASIYQPGNGAYPSCLSTQSVKSLSSDMQAAQSVLVTTLATWSCSTDSHTQQENILSTLSLSFLDQFDQRCHKVVYKLANACLISLLSRLLQEHRGFSSASAHTALSVEAYAQSIGSHLEHFWTVFQKVFVLVRELYDLSNSESQKIFSLPLLLLRRLSGIVSRDLLACNRLAMKMLPLQSKSRDLQGREAGFLQGSVAKRISKASGVLDSIRGTLTTYFSKGLSETMLLTGFNIQMHDSSNKKQSYSLLNIPHLLQTCQLKQALELVYSVLAQGADSSDDVPTCHISVPGINLTSPKVLASLIASQPCHAFMLQLLARFMDAFFRNKTSGTMKCIIPPIPNDPSLKNQLSLSRRCMEVAYKSITKALGEQHLSHNWTPTHAIELYLLSGEWHEAARLAVKKGDWKKGLMLCTLCSLAYRSLQVDHSSPIPVQQFAHQIAYRKIVAAVGLSRNRAEIQLPVEQPLFSISSILSVCGHCGIKNIDSEVSFLILHRMWKALDSLPVQVPQLFELPATPFYDLASPNNECDVVDSEEKLSLSHLFKSYLWMLYASDSSSLCHGWYSSALLELHCDSESHPRCMPGRDGSIGRAALLKQIAQTNGPASAEDLSDSSEYQLALFREFCGLLWLLHVRDNASHHLRLVFPPTDDKVDASQPVSECALWCTRLVPLQHCFTHKESSDIEDILLSVISELPCNRLMATLLAQNFPEDCQYSGSRKCKLDRLLARMRTTMVDSRTECTSPQPLSVDYQIMSKAVLENQESDACDHFRPQCFRLDNEKYALKLNDKALKVGSYAFEHDQAYIDFLDSLFSKTHIKPSVSLSQSLYESHQLPKVSAQFSSQGDKCETSVGSLQPVVNRIYEWSQTTDSTTQTAGNRQKRKDTAEERIEVTLSFLMYCLHLEEEKHLLNTNASSLVETTEILSSSMTTITPVPDDSSSTLATFTSAMDSHYSSSITTITPVSESTITTVTPVLESTRVSETTVTPDIDSATLSDTTLHAEDLDAPSTDKHIGSLPLLQIPSISDSENGQSMYEQSTWSDAVSVPSLTLTTASTSCITVSGAITLSVDQEEISTGQVVPDITDSQSIGELPSQLTLSVGEVGSGVNFGDTLIDVPSVTPQTICFAGGIEAGNNTHVFLHAPLMEHLLSSEGDLRLDVSPNQAENLQTNNEQSSPKLEQPLPSTTDTPHGGSGTQPSLKHPTSPSQADLSDLPSPQHLHTCTEDSVQPTIEMPTASIDDSLRAQSPVHTEKQGYVGTGLKEEEEVDGGEIEDGSRVKEEERENGNECVGLQEAMEEVVSETQLVDEDAVHAEDTVAAPANEDSDHNMLSVSDQRTPVSHVRRPRDAGQHEKDIGSIIKSEMERFFKTQHEQLIKLLEKRDSSSPVDIHQGLATTTTSTTTFTHTPTHTSPKPKVQDTTSEQEPSYSTGHLSVRHLQHNPSSPDIPLLRVVPHLTPTHLQPHTPCSAPTKPPLTQSFTAGGETDNQTSYELPLLKLDEQDKYGLIHECGLPQLPIRVSPPKLDALPLLNLQEPTVQQALPTLPIMPHVLQPTSQLSASFHLPLLQCPHPDLNPNNQTTFNSMPLLPTLVPSTASSPLPLLVPTAQHNLPILPPMQLQPMSLLPPGVVLQNKPSLSLLHVDDAVSGETEKRGVSTQTENQSTTSRNNSPVTENRPSVNVQPEDQTDKITHDKHHPPPIQMSVGSQHAKPAADDTQLPLLRSTGSQTESDDIQHSSTERELTTHTALPSNNEHVQIDGTHTKDLSKHHTLFPSNESEGFSVDLPSGQTHDNYAQTATSQTPSVHTERKFIRVVDINTDDREFPFSSSDEASLVGETLSPVGEVSTGEIGFPSEVMKGVETKAANVVSEGVGGEGGAGVVGGVCEGVLGDRSEGVVGGEDGSVGDHGEEDGVAVGPVGDSGGGGVDEGGGGGNVGDKRAHHMTDQHTVHGQQDGEGNDAPSDSVRCEHETRGRGEGVRDVARSWMLSQLHHLEGQLSAIENTARTVQGELLASNQLLGTIDELQSVGKAAIKHHTAVDQHDGGCVTTTVAESDTLPKSQRSKFEQPIAPHCTPTPYKPLIPPSPSSALIANARQGHDAPRIAVPAPLSLPPYPKSTPSERGRPGSSTQQNGRKRQHHQRQHHQRQHHVHFGNERSSLLLSGRCSKQTLRKWVSEKKREKCSSSSEIHPSSVAVHQIASQSPARSQRQDHMNRRLSDALTLMEDILSSEPPSPSQLHTTTTTQHTNTQHTTKHHHPTHKRRTVSLSSQAGSRYCSSTEGLTEQEQLKMVHIMASTELSSVSSGGSIASNIDWELVDQLIDS